MLVTWFHNLLTGGLRFGQMCRLVDTVTIWPEIGCRDSSRYSIHSGSQVGCGQKSIARSAIYNLLNTPLLQAFPESTKPLRRNIASFARIEQKGDILQDHKPRPGERGHRAPEYAANPTGRATRARCPDLRISSSDFSKGVSPRSEISPVRPLGRSENVKYRSSAI